MTALDPWAWAALGVAAVVIGISKTALPGGSILAIALFAAVLPARTSTAATLLLLMVGDVFALLAFDGTRTGPRCCASHPRSWQDSSWASPSSP